MGCFKSLCVQQFNHAGFGTGYRLGIIYWHSHALYCQRWKDLKKGKPHLSQDSECLCLHKCKYFLMFTSLSNEGVFWVYLHEWSINLLQHSYRTLLDTDNISTPWFTEMDRIGDERWLMVKTTNGDAMDQVWEVAYSCGTKNSPCNKCYVEYLNDNTTKSTYWCSVKRDIL